MNFTLCGESIIMRVLNAIVSCRVDDIFVLVHFDLIIGVVNQRPAACKFMRGDNK